MDELKSTTAQPIQDRVDLAGNKSPFAALRRLTMSVCGADVRPVECVRDLGVLIDSNMTLLNHVNNVAGICFYQLRQLRIIRRSLTTEAAHSLVRALIHTRVDYCNGLLAAGPKYLHEKVTVCPPCRARLVLQLPHRASVFRHHASTVALARDARSHQVQTVHARVQCLHGLAPRYLSDSACLPRCTLTSDHLRHLKDLCQSPGRKPRR